MQLCVCVFGDELQIRIEGAIFNRNYTWLPDLSKAAVEFLVLSTLSSLV